MNNPYARLRMTRSYTRHNPLGSFGAMPTMYHPPQTTRIPHLLPLFVGNQVANIQNKPLPVPEELVNITTTKYIPGVTEIDPKICANWNSSQPQQVKVYAFKQPATLDKVLHNFLNISTDPALHPYLRYIFPQPEYNPEIETKLQRFKQLYLQAAHTSIPIIQTHQFLKLRGELRTLIRKLKPQQLQWLLQLINPPLEVITSRFEDTDSKTNENAVSNKDPNNINPPIQTALNQSERVFPSHNNNNDTMTDDEDEDIDMVPNNNKNKDKDEIDDQIDQAVEDNTDPSIPPPKKRRRIAKAPRMDSNLPDFCDVSYGNHDQYFQNLYHYQNPSICNPTFNNPTSDADFANQIGNVMNSMDMPPKFHNDMPAHRHSMVNTPLQSNQPQFRYLNQYNSQSNTDLGGNINNQQYQQISNAVAPYGVNIKRSNIMGSVFNNTPTFASRMYLCYSVPSL